MQRAKTPNLFSNDTILIQVPSADGSSNNQLHVTSKGIKKQNFSKVFKKTQNFLDNAEVSKFRKRALLDLTL